MVVLTDAKANPPPSAQDAEDGAPEKARTHRLKPACGRQACATKQNGDAARARAPTRLLRVAVVAGRVGYVEGLIEAKVEFRFGRDAKRFNL